MTTRANVAAATALVAIAAGASSACGGDQPRSSDLGMATLHVRQEWERGGLYVEGAYAYVRLERDGESVTEVRLSDARIPRATIQVAPGSYRLVSFQRPCDGNCSRLDPPTDVCSRALEVEPDAQLRAIVRLTPGKGCTIDEEHKID
jgi:hypothetical protein